MLLHTTTGTIVARTATTGATAPALFFHFCLKFSVCFLLSFIQYGVHLFRLAGTQRFHLGAHGLSVIASGLPKLPEFSDVAFIDFLEAGGLCLGES